MATIKQFMDESNITEYDTLIKGVITNKTAYVPNSGGTSGQILISNGNGNRPTWGNMRGCIPRVNTENEELIFEIM